jgi:HK97 family phage major capsid protein
MPAQTFNLGRAIRGMAADSFRSIKSDELEITRRLEAEHGSVRGDPRFACRVPAGLLLRDLTAGTASAGGFLVNSTGLEYAPALRPRSVVLRAGAQVVPVKGGAVFVPRGASGITTAWLVNEATQASESQPVFGIVQPTPKMLSAYCEVSRQLLLQSNADAVLRQEILAAAATALDAAALNGSGASGEPLGIIGTPGIGSVTGTSLAYAGIVEFQQDVATAGAGHDPATCAYVAPLATASLLKQRQRVASTDSPLWRGPLTGRQRGRHRSLRHQQHAGGKPALRRLLNRPDRHVGSGHHRDRPVYEDEAEPDRRPATAPAGRCAAPPGRVQSGNGGNLICASRSKPAS